MVARQALSRPESGSVVTPLGAPRRCPRDGAELRPGIAIQQTYTAGAPDFPGPIGPDDVVTMSPGGPGRLVRCWKCPACGWSVR